MVLQGLRNYVYERRRRFTTFAGVVGGVYLAGQYALDRLEELRTEKVRDRQAREHLRKRFEQNQQDVSYTIMTLLPTLSQQIMNEMDVENLTRELQSKSKNKAERPGLPEKAPSEASLTSSVEFLRGDAQSEMGSVVSGMSFISSREGEGSSSQLPTVTQSWVEDFTAQQASVSLGPSLALPSEPPSRSRESSVASGANLSDSITSESIAGSSDAEHSRASRSALSDRTRLRAAARSKAELWREVKILTFTRALTIVYSTTLLSLLTNIQLNLIGRSKYVQSVIELHREDQMRERMQFSLSVASLFWGGLPNLDQPDVDDVEVPDSYSITELTELKFLTLSWWLLHVGWKDVRERVRRSVEEVFEDVPLKSQLDAMDVHRLICDVRRRVEHEVTYEGTERKINFLSALLPSPPEMTRHVLIQGGIDPEIAASLASDPKFTSLQEETREIVTSPHFGRILEGCLDSATDHLMEGLRKSVFSPPPTFGTESEAQQPPETAVGEITSIRVRHGEVLELRSQEAKIRLAGMLPGFARWCRTALDGVPNVLVDELTGLKEMSALAAAIYTSYDDLL